jgi:DNA-binding HxlR family transcriptional regulator
MARRASRKSTTPKPVVASEAVDELVYEMIGRIADRRTMYVLEALTEHGTLRFTRISEALGGISQKMLTQTLRQMERDGLLVRTVHPVIPPHVDYGLTALGRSLAAAFCDVWLWVDAHHAAVTAARRRFDAKPKASVPRPRRA